MTNEEKQYHINTIVNAIMEAESYVKSMDINAFNQAEQARMAVGKNLQLIGQESRFVKDFIREEFSDFDVEVLERLALANFDAENEINYQPIYNIVKQDFPKLRDKLLDISEQLNSTETEGSKHTLR